MTEFIQFHAALQIYHQDDLKKRMNRRTEAWQNGCFRKIIDHLVNSTPDHHPPKNFSSIILATVVRYSSTSPKQLRHLFFSIPHTCNFFLTTAFLFLLYSFTSIFPLPFSFLSFTFYLPFFLSLFISMTITSLLFLSMHFLSIFFTSIVLLFVLSITFF